MKVLIIDDDDMLIDTLKTIFVDDGAEVETAMTDTEANTAFFESDTKFDWILCDWDLGLRSKMNGADIYRAFAPFMDDSTVFSIWSGLTRDVPDGVSFFCKSDTKGVLDCFDVLRKETTRG